MEVTITGTVDVSFEENTSIYPVRQPTIRTIQRAKIIDRETLKTRKEYEIYLNSTEVRSLSNSLRKRIIQDFHIEEVVDSKSTIFAQYTPIHTVKKLKQLYVS